MEARSDALLEIVSEIEPATVRQVYYQATVRGIIDKTESGYCKVQRMLVDLRRAGDLPYDWISDNTRFMRKPRTYSSAEQALERTAATYRKALWDDTDAYVEIWLEKDALSGVIFPVTSEYDVPLMVARGYASLSFLYSAAEHMETEDRPCFVYHLGDLDPSGVNAGEKIEETLRELAPSAEIHFERLAVTWSQVSDWNLPSRPTKRSDTRSKNWRGDSVELDAIHPDQLRQIVRDAIERHLSRDQLEVLKVAEKSERDMLWHWADEAESAS
jgi:hypothetical protein